MEANDETWTRCADRLPPEGELVETRLGDDSGERNRIRNEQPLRLRGRLWFFADDSMYVYYTPEYWRPIAASPGPLVER